MFESKHPVNHIFPTAILHHSFERKQLSPVSTNRTTALNALLAQIAIQIAAGTTTSGVVTDGQEFSTSTAAFLFPDEAEQNTVGSTGSGPKAYLNWLVFDRDYNTILGKCGYMRLSHVPKEAGQDVDHERLFSPEISIDEPGFVYIYLSNENETPVEVFFDDFEVEHIKSPVVQMNDYYPFGLTFNSYSRENSMSNQYQNSGREKQDELGLNWIDFGARSYLPDIGRWNSLDDVADMFDDESPYSYAANNPAKCYRCGRLL